MAALVLLATSAADAAVATWNPNPEPDIAGYKLSYGTQSGVHPIVIDVGKVTSYTFSPRPGQRYYVVVQAYNTFGQLSDKSAEAVVDIPLIESPASSGPSLVQPSDQTTMVNTSVTLLLSGSSSTARSLTYAATALPPGLSINASSGQITGIANTAGIFPVTVTVSDGTLSASRTFTWTVVSDSGRSPSANPPVANPPTANRPPTLVQTADQFTVLNAVVSLKISANDPEGGAVTYSATGLPTGLSINAQSGMIAGSPTAIGSYAVTLIATDGTMSASQNLTWTITAPAPAPPASNRPPTLVPTGDQASALNGVVSLKINASDPEGAALQFTATGLPPGLSINSQTGFIEGSPSVAGSYIVTLVVSDGSLSTSGSFSWTIAAAPRRSSADSTSTTEDASAASADDYLDVSGDFDGDGRLDLATYRKSSSEWRIWTSSSNFATPTVMVWGEAGDRPMPADYNGDRITDFAIYRPSTGTWHISLSGTQTPLAVHWGDAADTPVTLDHDGDGKADLAVIREGRFAILLSGTNYTSSVEIR